jgi:hypothetical protein
MDAEAFDRAADFVWRHARLLDRRRFAHTFVAADADGVADAVLAYRNPDGGFGNALEPDCRTPHSQPQATRIGLHTLAGVGRLDAPVASAAARWLESIATPSGGVPFCTPTVAGYPRARWWEPEGDPPPPNLNPTAALVGPLRAAGTGGSWLEQAERWCFDELERLLDTGEPLSQYQVECLPELVGHAADQARARDARERVLAVLASGAVVPLDPAGIEGEDPHTPLQLAPTPDHPFRAAFPDNVIDAFLEDLGAEQHVDGGWPIGWPAPGETAVWEWRGHRTVEALCTLRAYGRLTA